MVPSWKMNRPTGRYHFSAVGQKRLFQLGAVSEQKSVFGAVSGAVSVPAKEESGGGGEGKRREKEAKMIEIQKGKITQKKKLTW